MSDLDPGAVAPQEPIDPQPTPDETLTPDEIADLRKKAAAFEDQKKRAEKAEGELKQFKQPKTPEPPAPTPGTVPSQPSDDVVRARLDARGVLDEDEQDAVIEAAKVLDISPIKALENDIVKGKLAGIRAQKATAAATPAPSRGGGTTTNIARLADEALQTGKLPSDPAVKAKVREEMRRRG